MPPPQSKDREFNSNAATDQDIQLPSYTGFKIPRPSVTELPKDGQYFSLTEQYARRYARASSTPSQLSTTPLNAKPYAQSIQSSTQQQKTFEEKKRQVPDDDSSLLTHSETKRNSYYYTTIALCIVALLCAGIGVGGWYLYKYLSPDQSSPNESYLLSFVDLNLPWDETLADVSSAAYRIAVDNYTSWLTQSVAMSNLASDFVNIDQFQFRSASMDITTLFNILMLGNPMSVTNITCEMAFQASSSSAPNKTDIVTIAHNASSIAQHTFSNVTAAVITTSGVVQATTTTIITSRISTTMSKSTMSTTIAGTPITGATTATTATTGATTATTGATTATTATTTMTGTTTPLVDIICPDPTKNPCRYDSSCKNEGDTVICLCNSSYTTGPHCDACGGLLPAATNTTHLLESVLYPLIFTNTNCTWTIPFNGGYEVVQFNVTDMMIGNETTDYLEFDDGTGRTQMLNSTSGISHATFLVTTNSTLGNILVNFLSMFGGYFSLSYATVDPCLLYPCNTTNSICQSLATGPHCECSFGFIGEYCDMPDPCDGNYCQNGAACLPDASNTTYGYDCVCALPFSGQFCT